MTLFNRHIRMTASELAMGRYMRAPDHPREGDDEFAKAFDDLVIEENKGGEDAGAAGAAASGEGDQGAAAGGDPPAGAAAGDGGSGDAGAADGGEAPAGEAGAAAEAGGEAAAEAGAKSGEAGAADAGGEQAGATGGDAKPKAAADAGAGDADAILDKLASAIAAKTPAATETPAAEAPAADEAPPLFSDVERAALDKFKEEWPGEYEAMNLMQRELGVSLVRHVFDSMAPVIREIRDTVQSLAVRTHIADLTDDLGGEYPSDEEIDQIKSWAGKQPTYLQKPMLSVIESGTAEEIADLVGRYREATGTKPAGAQANPKPQGGDELSGAAKKAAAALAPVDSKRSNVQVPDATDDFDAMFDKYAALEV